MNNTNQPTNQDMMIMMFRLSKEAGMNYMKALGYKYKPWYRVSKTYRNDKCSCGSNKKVKNCCGVEYNYDIKK